MKSKYISSDRRVPAAAAVHNAVVLFLLAVLVLVCGGGAPARAIPVSVDHMRGHKPLLPYLSWLPDKDGGLTISDVSTSDMAARFSPVNNRFPLSQQGALWVRLLIVKSGSPMQGGGGGDKLLLHLGDLLGGEVEVFYPNADGPAFGHSAWASVRATPGSAVVLPEPGVISMPVFIRFSQTPGLWFTPYLSTQSTSETPFMPPALLLPGLLAVGILVCLLRLGRERMQWAFWAALFLACVLLVVLFPLSDRLAGVDIRQIIPMLAPGVALMLVPHLGRHLLRTKGQALVQDGILRIYPVLGAALCLVPLLPGLSWVTKFFPLWPLLLVPLLPVCFGALAGKRPGALAFTGICVLPIIGACFTFYSIGLDEVHSLEVSAGLWGFALGGIGLALARSPRVRDEAEDGEDPLPADNALALSTGSGAPASPDGGANETGYAGDDDFPLGRLEFSQGGKPGSGGSGGLELADFKFGFEEAEAAPDDGRDVAPSIQSADALPGEAAALAEPGAAPDDAARYPVNACEQENIGVGSAEAAEEPVRLEPAAPGDLWLAEDNASREPALAAAEERPRDEPAEQIYASEATAAGNDGLAVAPALFAEADNKYCPEKAPEEGQVAEHGQAVAEPQIRSGLDAAAHMELMAAGGQFAATGEEGMADGAVRSDERSDECSDERSEQPVDFEPDAGGAGSTGEYEPRVISLGAEESASPGLAELEDYSQSQQSSVHMGENSYVFKLHELVREVHEAVRPLASGKNLVFSWFIAPSLPALLEGDASRLRQTLSLLLQSAVQATEPGGAVQLTVRKNPAGTRPTDLLIVITDSGSVKRSDAGFFHAWDLAARTGGAFSLEYSPGGGTVVSFTACFQHPSEEGLHLHQEMQKIVDAGAELEEFAELSQVEPLSGQSELFEYAGADELRVMPAQAAHLAAQEPQAAGSDCPPTRPVHVQAFPAGEPSPEDDAPRVIVAEMTTSQRRLLANYMGDIPHTRAEARSTEEVLRLYAERAAVLVIFDGDMPEADIVQAMHGIRRWEVEHSLHAAALLVLTSHEAQSERMLAAGCDRVLLKPFAKQTLERVVAELAPALVSLDNRLDEGADAAQADSMFEESEFLLAYRANYGDIARPASEPGNLYAPEPASYEVKHAHEPGVASAVSSVAEEKYLAQSPVLENEVAAAEDNSRQSQEPELWYAPISEPVPASEPEPEAAPAADPGPACDPEAAHEPAAEPVAHYEDGAPAPETWWEHSMPRQDGDEVCAEQQPSLSYADPAAVDGRSAPGVFAEQAEPSPASGQASHWEQEAGRLSVSAGYVPSSQPSVSAGTDSVTVNAVLVQAESGGQSAMTGPSPFSGQADGWVHAEEGGLRESPLMGMIIAEDGEAAGQPPAQPYAKQEKPVVELYPLPGLDESIPVGAMPLLPGLIQSLGEALSDAKEGCRRGSTIIVQEAVGRLAGKAEVNSLETLKRIALCVERAASADDLEAVSDLMVPLEEATIRYMDSLKACYDGFVNLQR